jgi:hypothetical protein
VILNGLWSGIVQPQPGHYRLRLVKRGPWVPALLYVPCPMCPLGTPLDRPRWLAAWIDGRTLSWEPGRDIWSPVDRVFLFGEQIGRDDWELLVDQTAYDRKYRPHSPAATPRKRIDWLHAPAPFEPERT